MDERPVRDMAGDFAGALDWWREAGLDCGFHDEPTRWVAPGRPEERPTAEVHAETAAPLPAAKEALSARPMPDRASWPSDLAGFEAWWLTEPWLDDGRVSNRVPPRGSRAAELMVVVPEPEREDRVRLLSGPDGRMLKAILWAMGVNEHEVYLASVLPRHTPAPDWTEISARGMGELLAHHIGLAGPKRLIFFGGNILSLTGNDLPQGSAVLQKFNHEGISIPLLAARSLPALRQRPKWKAELWRTWLEWTDQSRPGHSG